MPLGFPLLIEDLTEDSDLTIVEHILDKKFVERGNLTKIQIGEWEVEIADGFMLYLSTRSPNLRLPEELASRLHIVDFSLTDTGYEEHILARWLPHIKPVTYSNILFSFVFITLSNGSAAGTGYIRRPSMLTCPYHAHRSADRRLLFHYIHR